MKNGVRQGKFDAETQIGFNAVNFSYVSKVSYKEPSYVLSVSSKETSIFTELYSLWEIQKVDKHKCQVKYKIQMTFNNPLYSAVTNQFFNFLATTMHECF